MAGLVDVSVAGGCARWNVFGCFFEASAAAKMIGSGCVETSAHQLPNPSASRKIGSNVPGLGEYVVGELYHSFPPFLKDSSL